MRDTTKRFIRGAAVMALSSLFMRTVAVFFNAAVSKRIGAEGMGLFSLVMSVWSFAVTLATSGVNLAVTRGVSEKLATGDEKGARRVLFHCLLYAAFFGTLTTVVLLLFARPLGVSFLGDVRTVPSLRLLAVSMLPLALSNVLSGYFIAARKVSRNAIAGLFEQFLRICAVTLLLLQLLPRGVTYACIALVGGGVVSEVGSFLFYLAAWLCSRGRADRETDSRENASSPADRRIFSQICAVAMPIAFSAYVRSGLLTAEHALIPPSIVKSGRTRAQALADYGLLQGMALPLVLYPTALLYAVSGMLIPEFAERAARGEAEGVRRLCGKVLLYTSLFSFGCGVLLFTFSRELGLLIYRSWEVGDYILALSPVLPVMFADHVTDCMLKGLGEQVWIMWVNILDSVLSILLVMLLLPKMGAAGYALVIVLAEILNFSLSFGRLLKKAGYRPHLSSVALPAAACLPAFLLTRLLLPMDAASATVFWTVQRMLFCLCVYTLTVFLLFALQKAFARRKGKSPLCLLPKKQKTSGASAEVSRPVS